MRKLGMAALSLAVLACGTGPRPAGPSPEAVVWRLVELDGAPARTASADAPTLHLNAAEGRAEGNTGCNGFSGPYELRGDSISFGALVSTRRACIDDGMNRQEGVYIGLLTDGRTWRLAGDTLVIAAASGSTARFVRAADGS